ncbi:DUF885 family protein [Apibacter sp. HY039]|uniref:DUF885 domain-containing protein n=1 Tax=Apibacter sp. HY039 TaxID=2501476 RepID=UPI000FEBD613|nr:DUF885 domain-containing protein [Apibacter sp. HY039]
MKKILVILTSCLFSNFIFSQSDENKSLYDLADDYYEDFLKLNPIQATMQGDYRYNDLLTNDISDEFLSEYEDFFQIYLQKLNKINYSQLNENSKIVYDVLKNEIELSLEKLPYHFERIPFTQFEGLPLQMPVMGSGQGIQPFKTEKDYSDWLKRVDAFSGWADTAVKNFKKGIDTGMVLPDVLVSKMIKQMLNEDIISADFEKNIFYGPIKNLPSDFTLAQKKDITQKYQQMIIGKIIPTYTQLGTYLKEEYLPHSRKSIGYNSLPAGNTMYLYWVKYWTTTNKTPEEFYQAGLKQVDSLKNEMNKVRLQIGFEGSLKDFLLYVKTDPKARPYTTPKQILDEFNSILFKIEPQLKLLFNKTPKTAFEIRQTEKFRENTASAEYYQGTADGSRPGVFYMPIPDATQFNVTSGMESLFLHEAIPGHHYQVSLQQENTSLPKFMRFGWIGSYGEGWALYCESLGPELGLYTDPYQKLGSLSDDMLRAVRLVIDTGIHTRNMSREQAIEYFLDHVAYNRNEAVAEVERYISYPAQALSYKAGSMKIQELKNKYRKILGNRFSISEFHDELLSSGCLPLNVLEKKMSAWAEKK